MLRPPSEPSPDDSPSCTLELQPLLSNAERAIQDLYNRLAEQAARQREQRARFGLAGSPAKRNREDLYLVAEHRSVAEQASRAFLQRRKDLLCGPGSLSADALRRIVALQHLMETDLEDIELPLAARRCEDEFVTEPGMREHVAEQFLLDATRGQYHVAGQMMDFAVDLVESGLSLEESPEEVERLKVACTDRLVAAVQRCLAPGSGDSPRPAIVKAVTMAMSQSGLANVERACDGPQVIVSGGEQDVRFELQPHGEGDAWVVSLEVVKSAFGACFVCNSADGNDAPQLVECGPASRTVRGARLRFTWASGDGGRVQAEVLDVVSEVSLVDGLGRPLSVAQLLAGERPEREEEVPELEASSSPLGHLPALAITAARLSLAAVRGCSVGCSVALALAGRVAAWLGLLRLLGTKGGEAAQPLKRLPGEDEDTPPALRRD